MLPTTKFPISVPLASAFQYRISFQTYAGQSCGNYFSTSSDDVLTISRLKYTEVSILLSKAGQYFIS